MCSHAAPWNHSASLDRASSGLFQEISSYPRCLFTGFLPTRKNSLIMRRHHCRWRTENFYLCSALTAIDQWGFLECNTYCDTGHPFIMFIFEDPWHSCTPVAERFGSGASLPVFLRLRYVVAGIRTTKLLLARRTLYFTVPPPCSKPWWWIDVHQNNKTTLTSKLYNHKSVR